MRRRPGQILELARVFGVRWRLPLGSWKHHDRGVDITRDVLQKLVCLKYRVPGRKEMLTKVGCGDDPSHGPSHGPGPDLSRSHALPDRFPCQISADGPD